MRVIAKAVAAALLAMTLAACSDNQPVTVEPGPTPDGVILPASGPVFAFDTAQQTVSRPVDGDAAATLDGQLSDASGRRALAYRRGGGAAEVLATSDWNLPPMAAVAAGGNLLACFNRLTGAPSRNTAPGVPDPTQGVALVCRLRTASGFGPEVKVTSPTRASWLKLVAARPDGTFNVVFYGDDGWLVLGAATQNPQHGTYAATFDGTKFLASTLLLQAFVPDARYNETVEWPFAKLADLWGGRGFEARTPGQLRQMLERALGEARFTLIDVPLAKGDISPILRGFAAAFKKGV